MAARDPYEAFWTAEQERLPEAASKSSSPWETLVFSTIVLGLLGFWWFRRKEQQNVTSASNASQSLPDKERRAQLAEARLRALQAQSSSTRGDPKVMLTEQQRSLPSAHQKQPPPDSKQELAAATSAEISPTTSVDKVYTSQQQPEQTPMETKSETTRTPTPTAQTIMIPEDEERKPAYETDPSIPIDSPTKKKKKKKHPPPIQMVCEALSSAGLTTLMVEDYPEAGSWGGLGWWKRPTPSSSKQQSIIRLSMHAKYIAEKEQDWKYLCECMLEGIQGAKQEILPTNRIRPAISCFNQLQKLSDQGHSPFLIPSHVPSFEHFATLCKTLQLELAKVISGLIVPTEDESNSSKPHPLQVDDEDEDDGLFSEDYDTSIPKVTAPAYVSSTSSSSTPWDDFMDLLCKDDIAQSLLRLLEKESPGLARRLVTRIFLELQRTTNAPTNQAAHHHNLHGFEQTVKWLQPLSKFYPFFTPIFTLQVQQELVALKDASKNGRQVEESLFLMPLVRVAAIALYAVDGLGGENARILAEFGQVPNFPICVYTHPPNNQISICMTSLRQKGRLAQRTIVSWLKAAMKEDKEAIFEWVRLVIAKNNSLASLAKSDLLDNGPSSTLSQSFSRSFLLGLASAFVDLCGLSLTERFDSMGATAFDAIYLLDDNKWKMMFQGESSFALSARGEKSANNAKPPKGDTKYSGSTNFFFLATALFRVALYPAIKIEREFYRHHSRIFDVIRAHAIDKEGKNPLPERFLADARHKVAIWLGWKAQLEEPDFVMNVTNFTLLQLKWALAQCRAGQKVGIPDWIVKDPARWLALVANHTPHLLRQDHAEQAIECSTELLEAGQKSFSPIVMTCLLRIATAFVHAGVNRARQRQNNRSRRWGRNESEQEFDSRDPSIYLSFDKNDLGVTVFTNRLVCTRLCPTLIRTFVTLDVVEGLNMDVEYDFDKFSVKGEIADLLLRLWSHPNGECRQSIVADVKPSEFQSFASSLAAALSVFFDDAVQKMSTTIKSIRTVQQRANDQYFIEAHSKAAASGFMGARRLLMLLCTLSVEESVASSFAGVGADGDHSVRDLANMMVHFIDIVTNEHGGTHPELELELSEPTHAMLQRDAVMSPDEKQKLQDQIERSRQFAQEEIGLDVSVVCHQLLALAASWHVAAKKQQNSTTSPLLNALVNHDDIDVGQWTRISNRMVMPITQLSVSESAEIFYRDGYYRPQVPHPSSSSNPTSQEQKRRRQMAKCDQMKHEEIDELLGSYRNIKILLEDLVECSESTNAPTDHTSSVVELQEGILAGGNTVNEEAYEEELSEYVVSSSPFASQSSTGTFVHYYDRTARSRISAGTGKSLVKEARKCHKGLPTPHANSSCFVCFAEERMDLCRAIITGPVDTPYAHGLFVFDVYFPPTYPSVPPLVTFMTTGGGQVRFNPNLYVDGKVCLSLLGLTFAQGESQRWNPQQSSLAQVLLSMQAQIFGVKEPYFNEGSGIPPQLRNTPAGREGSRKHNAMLRLATLRHAVVAQLRNPPLGFEEVTLRHFSMCKKRLVVQARRWMLEEEGTPAYPRFEKVYAELLRLLQPLDYGGGKRLLPLAEDAAIVEAKDKSFPPIEKQQQEESKEDQKLSAFATRNEPAAKVDTKVEAETETEGESAPYNPWANPESVASTAKRDNTTPGDDSNEDEDMYS